MTEPTLPGPEDQVTDEQIMDILAGVQDEHSDTEADDDAATTDLAADIEPTRFGWSRIGPNGRYTRGRGLFAAIVAPPRRSTLADDDPAVLDSYLRLDVQLAVAYSELTPGGEWGDIDPEDPAITWTDIRDFANMAEHAGVKVGTLVKVHINLAGLVPGVASENFWVRRIAPRWGLVWNELIFAPFHLGDMITFEESCDGVLEVTTPIRTVEAVGRG